MDRRKQIILKSYVLRFSAFFYIIFTHGLSDEEVEYLRSQFVTANISSKSRSKPYVFMGPGVYMLMTVLKGELAVRQSIELVRTFKKIFGETVNAGFCRAYQERRSFSYIKKYNTIMNHSIKKLGKEKGIKYVGN